MYFCLSHVAVWNLTACCVPGVTSRLVSFYLHLAMLSLVLPSSILLLPSVVHPRATAHSWILSLYVADTVLPPSPDLSTDVSCFCILLYNQVWNTLTLGIIFRYFVWKESSSFFSSVSVSFYVTHPYNNTEMIRLWKERLWTFRWCW